MPVSFWDCEVVKPRDKELIRTLIAALPVINYVSKYGAWMIVLALHYRRDGVRRLESGTPPPHSSCRTRPHFSLHPLTPDSLGINVWCVNRALGGRFTIGYLGWLGVGWCHLNYKSSWITSPYTTFLKQRLYESCFNFISNLCPSHQEHSACEF